MMNSCYRNPNKNPDGTYTADAWPKYTQAQMEYLNLTVESDYAKGAKRTGTRREQFSEKKFQVADHGESSAPSGSHICPD